MRDIQFQLMMSPDEKKRLQAVSIAKGVSMSDYVRLRINEDYNEMDLILGTKTQIDMNSIKGGCRK